MRSRLRPAWAGLLLCSSLLLAACGGGGGDAASESASGGGSQAVGEMPSSREQAARFLTQASFGPTDADIDRVMAIGYGAWIDEQLAKPASSHRATWDAANAAIKAANPSSSAGQDQVLESFWKQAISGEDQLRQRMAYALSQIFVISMMDDNVGNNPRAVAAWLDMLGDKGLGSYRDLLESVSRHPLMGQYLSHLRNQKADARTGRVPDENYAREVMQLFSIGLVALNADGTVRSDGSKPLETYGASRHCRAGQGVHRLELGLPRVAGQQLLLQRLGQRQLRPGPQLQEHARLSAVPLARGEEVPRRDDPGTVAVRPAGQPAGGAGHAGGASQRRPLHRQAADPAPGDQQPQPAVRGRRGLGLQRLRRRHEGRCCGRCCCIPRRGGRRPASARCASRCCKLSAYLRAFGYRSDSGNWRVGNTDNTGSALGQTPLRSPSVFNFYRPGYVPPGTEAAAGGLAAPEMQIAHETTAAGYVNYMRDNIA